MESTDRGRRPERSEKMRLSSGACGHLVLVVLKSPPGFKELQPELRDAGGGDVKSSGSFRSGVTVRQSENQPLIAARLAQEPSAENQDGRRPGRGWEWRMREWPSRSNESGRAVELVDAFKPQSSATGNEETGDVAAISSASNMAAVADMKHGKSGQGRSKDLIMAALIDQPPVGHECRDQGFLKHVLTESGGTWRKA